MKNLAKIWTVAALLMLALIAAPTSQAYTFLGVDWQYLGGNPVTVNIYIYPNCLDPNAPNELASLQAGMGSWSSAGANFAFNYAGPTNIVGPYYYDGQNTVGWTTSSGGGALAATYYWGGGGNMTQADMVFYDEWSWNTNIPSFSEFDVQSVGVHEFGHIVGLGHSQYNWAIMWPYISNGEVHRDLSSDDIAGILAIYGAGAAPNLTVDLTPTGSTTVPAGGGSIPYTVSIHNNGSGVANFAVWTEYYNFMGGWQGYVIQRPSITLGGGGTIFRSLTLIIAGTVPAGTYTYYCRTGPTISGSPIYAQDSFQFTKLVLGNGSPWISETSSSGWDDPQVAVNAVIPESFHVNGAFPNPFNPETSIQFDLPQATQLNLAIYDMQGAKVVDLLSGSLGAGRYTAKWNAANVPSGTYIYRLSSDLGQASGKLVLVK